MQFQVIANMLSQAIKLRTFNLSKSCSYIAYLPLPTLETSFSSAYFVFKLRSFQFFDNQFV